MAYHDAINRFFETVETDVLEGIPGRLYVNDSYLLCYITASVKTEWEDMAGSLDNAITITTDSPWWIRENTFSWRKQYLDFSQFTVRGKTIKEWGGATGTYKFRSVAQDGILKIATETKEEPIQTHSVEILKPLIGIQDYCDLLYRGNSWAILRRAWIQELQLEHCEKILYDESARITTYRQRLSYRSNGVCSSNEFEGGAEVLPEERFIPYAYAEGTDIQQGGTVSATVTLEITGTRSGLRSFDVIVSGGEGSTYEELSTMTYQDLGDYTYLGMEGDAEPYLIPIMLARPMYDTDRIARGASGRWAVLYQNADDSTTELPLTDSQQEVWNNIPSHPGGTRIDTNVNEGDKPFLKAWFNTPEFAFNMLPDGTFLRYPMDELIAIEGDTLYIRLRDRRVEPETLQVLYALEKEWQEEVPLFGQQALERLCDLEELTRIRLVDPVADNSESELEGSYPHDYPHGYGKNTAPEILRNEALSDSQFMLKIYGKCVNPKVLINGHMYQVLDSLAKEEYLVIDSRHKSIWKHTTDGDVQNLFAKRYKEESIFMPIQPGENTLQWDREFGFDLTLFLERGEPEWN